MSEDLKFRSVTEYQDFERIAYQCDGHVDKQRFLLALVEERLDEEYLLNAATVGDVEHCYKRFVPTIDGGGWLQPATKPGRGVKAITELDLANLRHRLNKNRRVAV